MADGKILSVIPKGNTEQLQISINEFKGKKYLDLRIYFTQDNGTSWTPTKKGVTISPESLTILQEAVEVAIHELSENE